MITVSGRLEPFSETGTEGVVWSVYEDGKSGYDGLHCLSDGDYLTVFDPKDSEKVIWEGNIDLEWDRNRQQYPMNPKYSQQEIAGVWVHGIQRGVDPSEWGKWFFEAYPAKMIRGPIPARLIPVRNNSPISGYQWIPRHEGTGKDFHYTDGDLIIRFRDNGDYYKYSNIPESVFNQFYEQVYNGSFIIGELHDKYTPEKLELPDSVSKVPEESAYPFPLEPL